MLSKITTAVYNCGLRGLGMGDSTAFKSHKPEEWGSSHIAAIQLVPFK